MRNSHDIYLIPGFFGFANLGRLTYFGHLRAVLAERCAAEGLAARIHVVRTHPTASLVKRAVRVLETIAATSSASNGAVHLIGHSSGGLDARLVAAPSVTLPTRLDVEGIARRIRTIVTVSTPHYGTPLASFLASRLGTQLLYALSLSTMYLLRFGHLPLRVLLPLGTVFARADALATQSLLLDQIFALLLSRFSVGRRRAVQTLFREVASDQALLVQLTPEAMSTFNATTGNRPSVRYGSVITRAPRPGFRSTLAAGLDPSGQATHAVYGALYRIGSQMARRQLRPLSREHARILRRAYGTVPTIGANDGIVPTCSQVWAEIIHATQADHLDAIGHFRDPSHRPPHVDWLSTGSRFTRKAFERLWTDVARFIARGKAGP